MYIKTHPQQQSSLKLDLVFNPMFLNCFISLCPLKPLSHLWSLPKTLPLPLPSNSPTQLPCASRTLRPPDLNKEPFDGDWAKFEHAFTKRFIPQDPGEATREALKCLTQGKKSVANTRPNSRSTPPLQAGLKRT